MDTISQNKNTVTSFIDALFTKGDLGAVDEYLAEDFVDHDPPMGGPANREGMRQAGAMFRAAFPDWHSDLGFLVEEGDLVVENFTASGTQQGEILGVPASGRTVSLPFSTGLLIKEIVPRMGVARWLAQIGHHPAATIRIPDGSEQDHEITAGTYDGGRLIADRLAHSSHGIVSGFRRAAG